MKNGMKDWQKTGSGADGGSKGMEKKQKVFKVEREILPVPWRRL